MYKIYLHIVISIFMITDEATAKRVKSLNFS